MILPFPVLGDSVDKLLVALGDVESVLGSHEHDFHNYPHVWHGMFHFSMDHRLASSYICGDGVCWIKRGSTKNVLEQNILYICFFLMFFFVCGCVGKERVVFLQQKKFNYIYVHQFRWYRIFK